MKANEFRIGNCILFFPIWKNKVQSKRPVIIEAIKKESIVFNDDGHFLNIHINSKEIEPVPLTAEILSKIGFLHCNSVETKGGDVFYDYDLMELGICGTDACGPSQIYYANCKYVHQLQNLYFALTGEELEINL